MKPSPNRAASVDPPIACQVAIGPLWRGPRILRRATEQWCRQQVDAYGIYELS